MLGGYLVDARVGVEEKGEGSEVDPIDERGKGDRVGSSVVVEAEGGDSSC